MEIMNSVLVLKVGSSSLSEQHLNGTEHLDQSSFQRIGKQILELQKSGTGIVLVSSAAITAGMEITNTRPRPNKATQMPELQRLASIGWRRVLNAWGDALQPATIGELLLTRSELGIKQERKEALQVTRSLLSHGNIPIINENDAIAHEEIAFGDNDTLAAILAARMNRSSLFPAVELMILSDIDGVYADPSDTSSIIPTIASIDDYEHLAQGTNNCNGTGGMKTKFTAARIAAASGVDTRIANGKRENVIQQALANQTGTHFIAHY